MNTPESKSVVAALKEAFGNDCVVVKNQHDNPDLLRQKKWVLEDLDGKIHVLLKGDTLGLIDEKELTFATEFGCNAENVADLPQSIAAQAQEWAEEEMWPAWKTRGFVIDETYSPKDHWDSLERLWLIKVIKKVESPEALVEELLWAADQEQIQFIQ